MSHARKTVVTFHGEGYNTSRPLPHFINPTCFGDDLARALIKRLVEHGVATDDEPTQEDFGWSFRFDGPANPHWFIVGYRPPDGGEATGTWIGWVERDRGLWASLAGRRDRNIELAAVTRIHRALASIERVSHIEWHGKAEFDAGNEEHGSIVPE